MSQGDGFIGTNAMEQGTDDEYISCRVKRSSAQGVTAFLFGAAIVLTGFCASGNCSSSSKDTSQQSSGVSSSSPVVRGTAPFPTDAPAVVPTLRPIAPSRSSEVTIVPTIVASDIPTGSPSSVLTPSSASPIMEPTANAPMVPESSPTDSAPTQGDATVPAFGFESDTPSGVKSDAPSGEPSSMPTAPTSSPTVAPTTVSEQEFIFVNASQFCISYESTAGPASKADAQASNELTCNHISYSVLRALPGAAGSRCSYIENTPLNTSPIRLSYTLTGIFLNSGSDSIIPTTQELDQAVATEFVLPSNSSSVHLLVISLSLLQAASPFAESTGVTYTEGLCSDAGSL